MSRSRYLHVELEIVFGSLIVRPQSRLLDRAAAQNRNEIAEVERVRLMERLLSHYMPNTTFDIQSLRQAAEELKSKHRDSESDAISAREDPNEMEDLAIDDEHFTIKAMPDNTTRMLSWRYDISD